MLHIQLSGKPGNDALLSVYDISGKRLLQQLCTQRNAAIDMRALATGIYFIHYDDGNDHRYLR